MVEPPMVFILECTTEQMMKDDEVTSRHIGANSSSNQRAADRALLQAHVTALADGEVAARDQHYGARGAHANYARTFLSNACLIGRCRRGTARGDAVDR